MFMHHPHLHLPVHCLVFVVGYSNLHIQQSTFYITFFFSQTRRQSFELLLVSNPHYTCNTVYIFEYKLLVFYIFGYQWCTNLRKIRTIWRKVTQKTWTNILALKSWFGLKSVATISLGNIWKEQHTWPLCGKSCVGGNVHVQIGSFEIKRYTATIFSTIQEAVKLSWGQSNLDFNLYYYTHTKCTDTRKVLK